MVVGGAVGVGAAPLPVGRAREVMPSLLGAAAEGRVTAVCKDDSVAVLAPLSWLGEGFQRLLPAMGSVKVTEARANLGKLIVQAAAGPPVVLTRGGEAIAVLIADIGAPAVRVAPPAVAVAGSRRLSVAGEVLKAGRLTGAFRFGLPDLDAVTGGLAGGVMVVAGEPNAGASVLALAAAHQIAVTEQKAVLYAASGLSKRDVVDRMVAARAGVSYQMLRAGSLPEVDSAAAR